MSLSRPKPPVKAQPARPNLPQHDLPDPYPRLMTLGSEEDTGVYEDVAKQLQETDPQAGVAKLLEMTLDETFYEYWEGDNSQDGDPRGYTRVHALRTLELMGEAAEVAIEPLLPLLDDEDDWLREELSIFYGIMGRPAIQPLARLLEEAKVPDETEEELEELEEDEFFSGNAADGLSEIAQRHPDLRDEVILLLEQVLIGVQDPELGGYIVIALMDAGAKESLEIIRQAFEDDRIDEFIVDMTNVEEHFGLREKRKWETPSLLQSKTLEPDETPAFNRSGETWQQPFVSAVNVGRNDPCPCGSGKKYKKCCGA